MNFGSQFVPSETLPLLIPILRVMQKLFCSVNRPQGFGVRQGFKSLAFWCRSWESYFFQGISREGKDRADLKESANRE